MLFQKSINIKDCWVETPYDPLELLISVCRCSRWRLLSVHSPLFTRGGHDLETYHDLSRSLFQSALNCHCVSPFWRVRPSEVCLLTIIPLKLSLTSRSRLFSVEEYWNYGEMVYWNLPCGIYPLMQTTFPPERIRGVAQPG